MEGVTLDEFRTTFTPCARRRPALLLTHLVDDRAKIGIWSDHVTKLRVADIVEETHDVKPIRLGA
jgi:hypothetical protein